MSLNPAKLTSPLSRVTGQNSLSVLMAILLLVGLVIATLAVTVDYRAFFAAGGHFGEFGLVTVKNPLQTPCLYGAMAFLIAFVWSLVLLLLGWTRQSQVRLNYLLVAATVFAWSNFFPIMLRFYRSPLGTTVGCSSQIVTSPWRTYCFGGSLMFLLALLVGLLLFFIDRPARRS